MDKNIEPESLSENNNSTLFGGVISFFKDKFGAKLDSELQELIENRDDTETPLSEEEKELISSVLKFSSITANDACVPRVDIIYVSKKISFDEVVGVFKTSGYSRLPVCGKDLDEVVGFITLKDVFRFLGRGDEFKLKDVMHPCTFVPESFSISATLEEMRKNSVQVAIVVDEYGGTTGLITVKDIMEELVGDLDDVNDNKEDDAVIELLAGRYQLDARLEIEDLDVDMMKSLGVSPDDEYETIGGFVLSLAGKVPEEGDSFDLETGAKLVVTKADGRRVYKVTYIPFEPIKDEDTVENEV